MCKNIRKILPFVSCIVFLFVTYISVRMNSIYGFILFGSNLVLDGFLGYILQVNMVKPFLNLGKSSEYDNIDKFTNFALIVFGILLPIVVYFTVGI